MVHSCLNCVREHLGKADGYLNEYATGRYPARFWKCIAQLSLAWEECFLEYPEIAKKIDFEKKKMVDDSTYWIDVEPLINEITETINQITEIVNQSETKLSPKDSKKFLKMLDEEVKPNKELKKAVKKYKLGKVKSK